MDPSEGATAEDHATLAALGVVAGLGIGGSLIYALKPAGEKEAKELEGDLALKKEAVGAIRQIVPVIVSYATGGNHYDHATPTARQLHVFLKGLSRNKFEAMTELLDEAQALAKS